MAPRGRKGYGSSIVRVSPRFRVTIPKAIRDRLGCYPGQRLSLVEIGGYVRLVPVPDDPTEYLCGIAKDGPSMTEELLKERARDLEHE